MKIVLFGAFCALAATLRATDFSAATGTNNLGIEVFRQLRASSTGSNLILSPYSIESALALAYVGAEGDTRAEMRRVLGLADDSAKVQAEMQALRTALDRMIDTSQKRAANARRNGGNQDPIEWHVANRLFGEQHYRFRPEFVSIMRDGFDAPFQPLDFRHAAEPARATINDWVAEETVNKIRNLIPRGGVTEGTRLVLVNALYLKAPWASAFGVESTQPEDFHFLDGSVSRVTTMHQSEHFGYAKEKDATIVTLPYVGHELQAVIVLPDAGVSLDALARELSPDAVARWASVDGTAGKVSLWLPKFRVESGTLELSDALQQLGMKQAFDLPPGAANFGGIAPKLPDDYLAISAVLHRTFVAVDEKGTEAAAATAVVMVAATAFRPEPPVEVRVDRPFLFAIQHRSTGVCLFLGQVVDPRE